MDNEPFVPVVPTGFSPNNHDVIQRFIRCGNENCHLYDKNVDGCSVTTPMGALDMYVESSIVCFHMQLWVEEVLRKDPEAQPYVDYMRYRRNQYFEMIANYIDCRLKENADKRNAKLKEE